jgi:sulfate permease, SulP family
MLWTSLREYSRSDFYRDLGAGTTVGVIALPLAIGFAIASGATPAQGLWTAIVAGALIAALGGSRFQIGGPTGAFVPVLAGVVAIHGYAGLALATVMAGGMLVVMGALRLGGMLKFIPYPVIAGFTAGIAVIIFTAQINEGLGLGLTMPQHVPQQFAMLAEHLGGFQGHTLVVLLLTMALLYGVPRLAPKIPPSIVAVVVTSVFVWWLGWPVATVASKFGGIPSGLPGWHWPDFSLERMRELMSPAFTIAALGGIESLLSATVADGMTDSRHDPNQELMGQGLANVVVPFVGGIAATGAIARTAANIRSGACSPVSGIVHAGFLLGVVLVAAPLAGYIPLATLAAILMAVAVRMGEWENFRTLLSGPRSDYAVMLTAFGLTVVFDLTIGVGAGLVMAVIMFVRRMESISQVQLITPETDPEMHGQDSLRGKRVPSGVVLYRLHGPFFFAAADKLDAALRGSGGTPRAVVFRMRYVPQMDGSGLRAFRIGVKKLRRDGVHVLLTGVEPQPMKVLFQSGLAEEIGLDNFCGDLDGALARCQLLLDREEAAGQSADESPVNH